MSVPKVGYAVGKCPVCGKILRRRRPADYALCDCFRYCPLCGEEMEPFSPDLAPGTYGVEEGFALEGQAAESPGWTVETIYVCYGHSPPYYSSRKPVEVRLS